MELSSPTMGTLEFEIFSMRISGAVNVTTDNTLNKSDWSWDYTATTTLSPEISLMGIITEDETGIGYASVDDLKTLLMKREEVQLIDNLLGTVTFVVTDVVFDKRSEYPNDLRYTIRGKVISW